MNEDDAVLAVNAAYYRAFAAADVAAIERLWAFDGATCVHPGWRPLVGRADVVRSYRDILSGAPAVPIVCREPKVVITGDFARVVCLEIVDPVLLAATNCFVRTGQGWLMAHHQASQIADMGAARTGGRDTPPHTLN
jgi:ketosteroid isomerase-like protein